jgi:glucose-1-phosphate adenylyltransferase
MMMKRVLAIILGGGKGSRLYPLTKRRAKPAVPLGGKYRLIDIPVSNCINSGIQKIHVLTQFNSVSLNRHISQTYTFDLFSDGFVEILAAEQTDENPNWFQGTADAVRQYLWLLRSFDVSEYLILSGDHLYRMDYSKFVDQHREKKADITIAVLPMEERDASSFGLIKTSPEGEVLSFVEKPEGQALLDARVDTTALGLDAETALRKPYIASMGIYVFSKEAMIQLLENDERQTDFGKDILPKAIHNNYNVRAYLFDGYWEDIGTVRSFYEANLALTEQPKPPFSFYEEDAPIYTRPRFLPPSKILDSHISQSIVSEGCVIKQAKIHHSVVGVRTRIGQGVVIEDSLLMGADYYERAADRETSRASGLPAVGIGENSHIKGAIIDKNARIGAQVQILNKDQVEEGGSADGTFYIRSGIVVIPKNGVVADGTVI